MSAISQFFLGSKSEVINYETLEISHPDMTMVRRIVRNAVNGVILITEESLARTFLYYPCKITRANMRNTLDQSMSITIGDVGDTLSAELDAIQAADGFSVKPTLKYRTWRSDVPTAPLMGPIILEISKISTSFGASTFEASAPRLNVSATGELYLMSRFPGLRGSV